MAKEYTRKYFLDRNVLVPHIAETVRLLAKDHRLRTILDVGTGSGLLVKYLNEKGFKAFGCDKSPEALKMARKINKKGSIKFTSATNLTYKSQTFDLVTSISVIEHLTFRQAQGFLKEAKRVLKPSGFIFLVTPNFATPLRTLQGKKWFAYSDPTHIFYYTPNSLRKLLRKFNFTNFKSSFRIPDMPSLDWEFPGVLSYLPSSLKRLATFLLFSTRLSFIRNSFWISAQK